MRLFIAINFNSDIKEYLYSIISLLKENNIRANFVSKDNLHLTLIFIGKSKKVNLIKNTINNLNFNNFYITTNKLGFFLNKKGDILWIGLDKNEALTSIYKKLYLELKTQTFKIDNRKFKPHITLGRKTILPKSFNMDSFQDKIKNKNILIDKISLMKSEIINGKLIYNEIN